MYENPKATVFRPLNKRVRMIKNKTLAASFVKASSPEYDATFYISSTSLDRDKDTFAASALKNVAQSTKKLLALWQHKQDQPVGYWENLSFDGNKLKADLKLSGTNLGKMIKQLLIDDVPLAASVGFAVSDHAENKKGGIEFKEVDMYECSIVSTPANAQAQRIKSIAKLYGVDYEELIDQSSVQLGRAMSDHDKKEIINQAAAMIEKANICINKHSN